MIGGFARWVHCQRIENEKRIARQQERGEFLKKLDVHLHKKSVCMGTHDASTRGMDGWRRGVTGSACIRPAPTSAHHCNSAPLRLLGNCECVFVPGSLRMCSDRPSWTCWPWTRCSRQRPSTKRRSPRRIFPVILFPLLPLFTLRLFSLANACSSTVLYAHATTHKSKQRNRRPSVLHPCAGEFVSASTCAPSPPPPPLVRSSADRVIRHIITHKINSVLNKSTLRRNLSPAASAQGSALPQARAEIKKGERNDLIR